MQNEFQQRVKLHTDCFHDDREWTERYLKRAVEKNLSTTVYSCDKIASTLYLEPMLLAIKSSRIPLLFINCLGTKPELRLKGFATELILKTFEEYQNTPLFVLLPFNVEFYKKQGFVPLNIANETLIDGNAEFEIRDYTASDYEFCKAAYSAFSERFDAHAVRTDDFLKWKFGEELTVSDSLPRIISKDGKPIGYACFTDENHIGEYAVLPPFDIAEVSAFRGKYYPIFGTGSPFMMSRLANAELLLKAIPYSERFCGEVSFSLKDAILPQNDGLYTLRISNGKLTDFNKDTTKSDGSKTLSAEQLTSLATGCFNAYDDIPSDIKSAFERRNVLFFDIF